MAVKIRMSREGRRNRAFFRIGAYDSRTARNGRSIEMLGHYNPLEQDTAKRIVVDADRVRYWFSQGAIPSESVVSLLKPLGIELKRGKATKKKDSAEA